MSISLKWENHNSTVLRMIFWNEWSIEDYLRRASEAARLIKSQAHDVDILIDLRSGSYIPRGDSVAAFRMMMDELPSNSGIIVYLNDNAMQYRLFNVQAQFYQSIRRWSFHPLYMVETLEEAYRLIETHRLRRVQPVQKNISPERSIEEQDSVSLLPQSN